jgi:two-component system response regulator HydG
VKKVLVVDDDAVFLDTCSELLAAMGYSVVTAASLADAKLAVNADSFQHLLLDMMLPDGSGVQLLELMGSSVPADTAVTIMTGHPAIKSTIKSIYGPNIGYLLKPVTTADLRKVLHKDLDADADDNGSFPEDSFDGLIGSSAPMLAVYEAIKRVAETSANVMLLGESGVGKELVAKAIHNQSRVSGRFVAANCGGFSRELIGSELFGHEKGAFTGATGRKLGVFEQAAGGTLFLDEITEMVMELQPNLLRVLEDRTFVRLGGAEPIAVDCRIISATNRDEASVVRDNCLRQDLLFRLAVFPITIPPLREREGDIPLLVEYFVGKFNEERGTNIQCSAATIARLQEYDWPGNVRELRHTLHRAHIMSEAGGELELPEQLGLPFSRNDLAPKDLRIQFGQSIEEMERHLIIVTLEKLGGDKKAAADVLGVSLKTLYNRLRAYEDRDAPHGSVAGSDIKEAGV